MYGIKKIGKYKVSFEGLIYCKDNPYEMILIQEFDGNKEKEEKRKVLYFRQNKGAEKRYVTPNFNSESEIEKYLKYDNYTKIVLIAINI